ncbi:PLP-dependent transferase [Streptococcus intermedius]|uniref:PLP-dependent transferase n=1 Tax=Streptococcus intermedius TaxID=1338 RepID=UPI000FBB6EF6|nr:Cystathionine gamma-synthase/O-acetylhomoserine (thiol)-lyase [Streptococcus intermedius]
MDKKLQLDTLLTYAGIKTDEVIGVLTAFLCLDGHNDVLAGAILANDKELYENLYFNLNMTGAVLSPFDSYLLLFGGENLVSSYRAFYKNAQTVAAFLKDSPAIKEVLYPRKSGMISFKVKDETDFRIC